MNLLNIGGDGMQDFSTTVEVITSGSPKTRILQSNDKKIGCMTREETCSPDCKGDKCVLGGEFQGRVDEIVDGSISHIFGIPSRVVDIIQG